MKTRKVIGPFEFNENDPEILDIIALFKNSSLHNARACLKAAVIAYYWAEALLYHNQGTDQILRAIDLSLSALDAKTRELKLLRSRLLKDVAPVAEPEEPDKTIEKAEPGPLDLF